MADARARYLDAIAHLKKCGRVDVGGEPLAGEGLDRGYFVAPTVAGIDFDDALWRDEIFAPLVLVGEVGGMEEQLAAAYIGTHMAKPVVAYVAGLTAPPRRRIGHPGAIVDQESTIRADVIRVRSHPLIDDSVLVGGFLYDVDTGLLTQVP